MVVERGVRLCTEFAELMLLLGSDEWKNRTHGFCGPGVTAQC